MTRIIRVVDGFCANEYDSFAKAVAAATKIAELNESKLAAINGKIVMDYQFNGDFLVISFNNGQYLTVSPSEKSIDWDVVSIKPQINEKIIEENVYFELASGTKILWDWKTTLDSFVGKQVAISPSDQVLFIFARSGNEYTQST